jgi:hypothetical protein
MDARETGPPWTMASITARWENFREMRRGSLKARSLIRSLTELIIESFSRQQEN